MWLIHDGHESILQRFSLEKCKIELFYHGKKNQKQHFLTQRFFTNNRSVFVFASKNVFKTCFRYTEGFAFLMPQKKASMVQGLRSLLSMLFLKKQKNKTKVYNHACFP